MYKKYFERPVKKANEFFIESNLVSAIQWYEFALARNGQMSSIQFNVDVAYRRLVERNLILGLLPAHDLEMDLDSKNWNAIGKDPFFLISDMSNISNQKGWFELNFLIDSPQENNRGQIYLDFGMDFSEKNIVTIDYKSGKLASKIFKTEAPILRLRFDPFERGGKFQIKNFTLGAVSESLALEKIISKILQHEKFKNQDLDFLFNFLRKKEKITGKHQKDLIFDLYESLSMVRAESNYLEWIERIEGPSLPSKTEIEKVINELKIKPIISIVMPVYNTPEVYLKACIDSVLNQSYPHWELCIADDNSPKDSVKQILKEYELIDSRIKVVYRAENGHISKASNSAIEKVSGDFIALLDHDDLLAKDALFFVAKAINQNPDALIIYSDEDKVDEMGLRFEPHFKSDWNPDLFYSQNYVSHLGVYKTAIVKKIKGFRAGVEGSQDQDLLLRCLPYTKPNNIIHIPRVLYHWRALEGSTALASNEKSYTTAAGVRALIDYFNNLGLPGIKVSEGIIPNTYRVHWPIPSPEPLVTLLIPTRDRKTITELAVKSILDKTTYANYEIIIIDNGSVEPETLAWFDDVIKDPRVQVLRYDKPFNYSAINNFGAHFAKGSLLGLINNDVEVIEPEWLKEMVSHAIRPDIGCVGAKLYYADDTIQHAGVVIGINGLAGHGHKNFQRGSAGYFARLFAVQNYSAVTAACLLVKKSLFNQVNGLDEVNLTVAFNDVDFCLKVQQLGYRNLWTPYAELYHHESVSRGLEDNPEKLKRFHGEVEFMQNKWRNELRQDPYYNPMLSDTSEDFSLKIT